MVPRGERRSNPPYLPNKELILLLFLLIQAVTGLKQEENFTTDYNRLKTRRELH
jgi:hypothetical protein